MPARKAKRRKKKPVPRPGLDRPFNDNQWTWNQFRTFVTKALRGARWAPRYNCIKLAYVADGVNPKTGRKCKLHRCAHCNELFPQTKMKADHIEPVVGPTGFVDWNTYVERLFVDTAGFQAICEGCHKVKTKEENEERKRLKDENEHHGSPEGEQPRSRRAPPAGDGRQDRKRAGQFPLGADGQWW